MLSGVSSPGLTSMQTVASASSFAFPATGMNLVANTSGPFQADSKIAAGSWRIQFSS